MESNDGERALKALLIAVTLSDASLQHEAAAAFQTAAGITTELKFALECRVPSAAWERAYETLEAADRAAIQVVTYFSGAYPPLLRLVEDPPLVLYVRGTLPDPEAFSVAIVGSRRSSAYGRGAATKFAEELAKYGTVIVSGLARGIDSCAHQGALSAARALGQYPGCAVLGSGVCRIYPPENEALAECIVQHGGALISEFGLTAEPRRQFFPQRNRIVSGMSRAVLVIEAHVRSGALITARLAGEQGREIFCLPDRIDSEESRGSNLLIRDGAQVLTAAEDVLSRFNIRPRPGLEEKTITGRHYSAGPVQSVLHELTMRSAVHFDELLEITGIKAPELAALLSSLELDGSVFLRPGQYYSRHQFIDT